MTTTPDDITAAIRAQDAAALVRALAGGADVNGLDRRGDTALTACVQYPGVKLLSILLEKGANVNRKDCVGRSPLLMAVEFDNLAAVTILLQKGARPLEQDMLGQDALVSALMSGREKMIPLLKDAVAQEQRVVKRSRLKAGARHRGMKP